VLHAHGIHNASITFAVFAQSPRSKGDSVAVFKDNSNVKAAIITVLAATVAFLPLPPFPLCLARRTNETLHHEVQLGGIGEVIRKRTSA
jgi:hypothetical protein